MYQDVLHDGCRATLTEIATEFYGLRRTKVIAGPEVRRYQQTIEDRYDYEHVGQGQSQIVFRLPDDYLTVEEDLVVKFALSPMDGDDIQDGVTQNETEIHRFETMPEPARNHLAPLVDIDDDDARWLIMPYAEEETDEAHAYLDRFEFHYVPKNGSWLNMAEIELGVLKRQCLDHRIYHAATLRSEVAAWQEHRNAADRLIDWQFTTDDARIKLRQLYPIEIEEN